MIRRARRFVACPAHRGVPTRTYEKDHDLEALFTRWGAKCSAIAQRHQRRYVDRMVKLAASPEFEVTQRGHTFGGGPSIIQNEQA